MSSKRRKVMRAFKLNEISAVDVPAQEGARMVLMKRHDFKDTASHAVLASASANDRLKSKDDIKKDDVVDLVTSVEDGHQHGIEIDVYDGKPRFYLNYAMSEGGEGHDHQLVRGEDGKITVTENAGHSHAIDETTIQTAMLNAMIGKAELETPDDPGASADNLGNQPTEDDMADKNAGDQSAELAKKNDLIKQLQAVVDLSPEHRAHYDTLPVSKRDDFLTKSASEKDADIEAIEKANPVIYTAEDGTEYRKSDDARLVKMAKERDEDRKEMSKFRIDAEQEAFSKQADDLLGLVPGEKVEKVATIRAISKIEDADVRKAAFTLLENAGKVYKMALSTAGVNETVSPANTGIAKAADVLKQAVSACAKEDSISEAQAYEKVLGTPEGQRLYDAARAERIASARINN